DMAPPAWLPCSRACAYQVGDLVEAAFYYSTYFNGVKEFVAHLSDDSKDRIAKELLNMEELPAQLATIKANFQDWWLPLPHLEQSFPCMDPFASKLNQVLKKNPGLVSWRILLELSMGPLLNSMV
ncbi:Putative LOC100897181, partial [Caligus rogercresseyi]